LDNRDQPKIWVTINQLARRNLTPEQTSYLSGLGKNLEAGDQAWNLTKCHFDTSEGDTATNLAKQYGVFRSAILRNAKFAEAVDKLSPEKRKEVLREKPVGQTMFGNIE
jgi:hypothetical protein